MVVKASAWMRTTGEDFILTRELFWLDLVVEIDSVFDSSTFLGALIL